MTFLDTASATVTNLQARMKNEPADPAEAIRHYAAIAREAGEMANAIAQHRFDLAHAAGLQVQAEYDNGELSVWLGSRRKPRKRNPVSGKGGTGLT